MTIVPIAVVTIILAYAARRVRRQASGLTIKEIKNSSDAERARTRRIQVDFRWPDETRDVAAHRHARPILLGCEPILNRHVDIDHVSA